MRFAAPPAAGSVQMLPCMSMASVRPSGETPTDIDVPSLTVTSRRVGAGAAANATWELRAASSVLRITKRLPDRD